MAEALVLRARSLTPTFPARAGAATLVEMNEQELRAYAVRGLTARLAELNDERAGILALLAEWGSAPAAGTRRRARTVARKGEPAVEATKPQGADRDDPGVLAIPPEREVARVLPRRKRVEPLPVQAPAPVLPPMPRLVKARAS